MTRSRSGKESKRVRQGDSYDYASKEKSAPKKSGAKRKPTTDADRERMRKSKAKQAKENKRVGCLRKRHSGYWERLRARLKHYC